jgi:calcineurin-like phosphoesterase family protein
MDAELEKRYSETVDDSSVVLWCGDVSFHDVIWTSRLLDRLPGTKLLVRGNHDGTLAFCLSMGFELVADFLYLRIAGKKCTVCHYPPARSTKDERYPERRPTPPSKNEFVIHGHTHEKEKRIGRRIHVGVDAWDFKPAPYSEIEGLVLR